MNLLEQPITKVVWAHVDDLEANHYNPNVVMNAELRLLEHSLLTTGWIQPILVDPDGVIIDGFHRWALSRDSVALRERFEGLVPCVVLELPPADAMLLTVRINRAKGSHLALRMHALVRELIDVHHLPLAEIAKGIGATEAEVDLLYQESIFKARNLSNVKYSQAWAPAEGGTSERI